jgi:hypothetical protein
MSLPPQVTSVHIFDVAAEMMQINMIWYKYLFNRI